MTRSPSFDSGRFTSGNSKHRNSRRRRRRFLSAEGASRSVKAPASQPAVEALEQRQLLATLADATGGLATLTGSAVADDIAVWIEDEGLATEKMVVADQGGVTAIGDFTQIDPFTAEVLTSDIGGGMVIDAGDGDDSLYVGFGFGSTVGPGGLTFNGEGGFDSIGLGGGVATFGTATFDFLNENDGSIDLDGTIINYTGIEPISSLIGATDVVLNYSGADETITLSDDGAASDGVSSVDSTSGEIVSFIHPTNSLTINGGGGVDTINLNPIDDLFGIPDLIVNGDDGNDVIDGSLTAMGYTNVTLNGGIGDDLIAGTQLDDTINGGDDNDLILGNLGADLLNGDAGDDLFVWNNGDGPDDITGGADLDEFIFNGADPDGDFIDISLGGGTEAGSGTLAGVDFNLTRILPSAFTIEAAGVETTTANGLSGNDFFTVADLTGATDLTTLNINGDLGNDTTVVFTSPDVAVNVDGGADADTLFANLMLTTDPLFFGGPTNGFLTDGNGVSLQTLDNDEIVFQGVPMTGQLTIFATSLNDVITVSQNPVFPSQTVVDINGSPIDVDFSAGPFIIDGDDGNDSLIVDYTNGNPMLAGGFTFHGNLGSDDITLQNDVTNVTTVHHTFDNENDGTIDIDGSVLTYTGLEPIFDNLSPANRDFTFLTDGITAELTTSPAIPASGVDPATHTRIDSAASEMVDFTTPTATLDINFANGASNTLTVTSLAEDYDTPTNDVNLGDSGDTVNMEVTDGIASPIVATMWDINGGAGDDTLNISPAAMDLDFLNDGVDFFGGAGTDTLNVNDSADGFGETFTITSTSIDRPAWGDESDPGVTYDADVEAINLIGDDDAVVGDTFNVLSTSPTATTTINGGLGDDVFNIDASMLGGTNNFSGDDGDDFFNVNLTGAAGITAPLTLNGDAHTGRDEVNINDVFGLAINGTFNYVDAAGQTTFTGTGSPLTMNTVETVDFNGDGNDTIDIVGTPGDDQLTVGLLPDPQQALVFLGGAPYLQTAPDTVQGSLPGVAGGSVSPDLFLNGVTSPLVLDGGGNTGTVGQGDQAIVYAASEDDLIAAGAGDVFGFGPDVLIPGFGAGNAFDDIDVNAPFAVEVSVVNNLVGPLMEVDIVEATFIQAGAPDPTQQPALIVNGGDEAVAQPSGISDAFVATPSPLFNIQVNGNLPVLGPVGPDGFPAGDELNLLSPEAINIFSDKATPPNVGVTLGSDIFGVGSSSIERMRLTPGNGVVNLIGDNNDPNEDQNDNFVVVGRDVDAGGSLDAGVQEMTVEINGSTPILIDDVSDLNVYGFDLVGELNLNDPDPNRVDLPVDVNPLNDIDTLDITPYADDTPRGWGVDVLFNEGLPDQTDGAPNDLLIYNTSAFGGEVSEDIVVRPSGPDNGELVVTNGSFGTPIVDIDYVGNTDIIVLDNDGFVNDTDTLTLLGTNPDTLQVSGHDSFVVDFDAAQTMDDHLVTVTDSASDAILYRLRGFTDPITGVQSPIASVTFDMLSGNDSMTFRAPNAFAFGAGVSQVEVLGRGGDDAVEVNLDGRDSWHNGRLTFDGGIGADALSVSGTPAFAVDSVTYDVGPIPGDGKLTFNDGAAPPMEIDFVDLEPVFDFSVATELIVNADNDDNQISYFTDNGAGTLGAITPGAGYANGVYLNVPLTGGTGSGAFANITVDGNVVTAVTLVNDGSGYTVGDVLSASDFDLGFGGGAGFAIPVDSLSGTVAIDNQEVIVFANKTNLTINSLAGNDAISIADGISPVGLTGITIDGGEATAGGGDQVTVSSDDDAEWEPSAIDGGTLTIDTTPPTPLTLQGLEALIYDGEGLGNNLSVTGDGAGTDANDRFIHTPGTTFDAGSIVVQSGANTLLGMSYQNLGAAGTVTVEGAGGDNSLVADGTDDTDQITVRFPGADAISVDILSPAGNHNTLRGNDIQNAIIASGDGDDAITVEATVRTANPLRIQGGNPGSGSDVLTVIAPVAGGAAPIAVLPDADAGTPVTGRADDQLITGLGQPISVNGIERIAVVGGDDGAGVADDTFLVNPGKGDNTVVVQRGSDVVIDRGGIVALPADLVTSDSLPDIQFTGMNRFDVDTNTNAASDSDVVTFKTRFLAGATPGNYVMAGDANDTLVIEGADGDDDHYTVRDDTGDTTVTDADGTGVVVTGASIGRLQINTLGGDDVVLVDIDAGGLPASDVIGVPIMFDGASGSDLLQITGTPTQVVTDVTYNPGPSVLEGRLIYSDDVGTPANTADDITRMLIDFANLEPVHDDTVVPTLTVNATDADNAIRYSDGPGGGIFAGNTGLVAIDAFETIEFNNKTTLVINGHGGSDIISLADTMTPVGLTDITVNGGDPTDDDRLVANTQDDGAADTLTVVPDQTGMQDAGEVRRSAGTVVDVDYTGIDSLGLVGQIDESDTFVVAGTTADDLFEYISGDTPDTGTVLGLTGLGGNLPTIDFSGMNPNATRSFNNVPTTIGGQDDFLFRGSFLNDEVTFGATAGELIQAIDGTTVATLQVGTPGAATAGSTTGVVIATEAGDDTIEVTPEPNVSVIVQAGESSVTGDTLTYNAQGQTTVELMTGDIEDAGNAGGRDASYAGIEHLNVTANIAAGTLDVTVEGTDVDDDVTVTVLDALSGVITTDGAHPNITYSNSAADGMAVATFDLGDGEDTLIVHGSAVGDRSAAPPIPQVFDIDVPGMMVTIDDDPSTPATNDGTVAWTANSLESLEVHGLEGDDTFDVTPGDIPVFIDGGDPIGETAGDLINITGGGLGVTWEAGPESDEGGFVVAGAQRVSYDHIEALGVFNAACAIVVGTNADDDITVIARDDSTHAALVGLTPGVEDFTTSVNDNPEILWVDTPVIHIDGLNGDDDITVRAPAPNRAIWDVDVFVAGGPSSAGDGNNLEGDTLVVETPYGDDTVRYTPSSPDSGRMELVDTGSGTTYSNIFIGQFVADCDADGVPDYFSSPGGVEYLIYDGVSAEGGTDINGNPIAPNSFTDLVEVHGDGFDATPGTASDDWFVHTPGNARDAGRVDISDTANNHSMLSLTYTNIGLAGAITINGQDGNDTLVAVGTSAADTFGVPGTPNIQLNNQVPLTTDGVENYVLEGLTGDDNFNLSPVIDTSVDNGSDTIPILVNAEGPSGSDFVSVEVNVLDAAPNDVIIESDSDLTGGAELIPRITQVGLGPITLSGVETAAIDANTNNLYYVGTRADDITTFTPLSEDSGWIVGAGVPTEFFFDEVSADNTFTITGGGDGIGGPTGGGQADKVILQATNGRDLIRVDSPNRTAEVEVLGFGGPLPAAGTVWRNVTLHDTAADIAIDTTVFAGGIIETITAEGRDGDDTFHVVPADAVGAGLYVNVEGGDPRASDALVVTALDGNNLAAPLDADDFIVVHRSRTPDAGNVLPFNNSVRQPSISYNNVEVVSANIDPANRNTGDPNLLIMGPDLYEPNEYRDNWAFIGSGATLHIHNAEIFPNAGEHAGTPEDHDYYRFVAQQTGTLDVQVYFDDLNALVPGDGNIDIELLDAEGNTIAGTGVFGTNEGAGDQNERIRIPAVAGQTYYLHVFGGTTDVINGYDVTIHNDRRSPHRTIWKSQISLVLGQQPPVRLQLSWPRTLIRP